MCDIDEVKKTVQGFLNGNKNNKALKYLLGNAPTHTKDKELKVRHRARPPARRKWKRGLYQIVLNTIGEYVEIKL